MDAPSAGRTFVGLAEIFPPDAIVVGLKDRTIYGAVAELVHHLVELGVLRPGDEPDIVESILARERRGTSALSEGVASPHCRSTVTERFASILGLEPEGVAVDANGGAVQSVFLFLAPLERSEELHEILGRITAIGRDKSRLIQLRGCRTTEAAHRFLQELDRS